jgi:DNA/RNA-binding domain of Phe-tRNA-synthetase-like protein
MHLRVSEEMAQRFPDLRISFVTIQGMDNVGESEGLVAELRAAEADFRNRVPDEEKLGEDARIRAWREAYQAFKVNPKKFKPSAEALLRRVVKGSPVPWISKAVNAYLLAELFYLLPVGGYDVKGVQGDVVLRLSPGNEPFKAIGATEEEKTDAGEVVYADDAKVLTRRWNFRDCDQAKVEAASRDIALFVEAPSALVKTEDLVGLTELIGKKIQQYCGGTIRTGLLDPKKELRVALPFQAT